MPRAQIIPPRGDLKRKAVNSSRGLDLRLPPEVVDRLEAVVHAARDGFTEDIGRRLAEMRERLAAVEAGEKDPGLVPLIAASSLAIKGAGGTIGYDLLTVIGKSLNDFVKGLKTLSARQREVVSLHIDALYVVLGNRITGRGGPVEAAVVEAFGAAVERLGKSAEGRDDERKT